MSKVSFYLYHGKSPSNHHVGEYVWNFFLPHQRSKSKYNQSGGLNKRQIESTIILRDFPSNSALFGLVSCIMTPLVPLVEWISFRVGLLKSQKRWHSNCKGMVIKGKASTICLWSTLRGSMKRNVEILNFHGPKWNFKLPMETQGIRWNIPIFYQSNTVVLGSFIWLSAYLPTSLVQANFPSIKFEQFNPWKISEVCDSIGKSPMSCVIRATHLLQKANPGIRIPWFIGAGFKNVLPGFLGLFFLAICYGLYRYQNHHETPPFWENSFGTLSKALPSTTATLHCLGGFEATNGQAMPSCTAAGAPEGLSDSLCWRWVFFWEGRFWGMHINSTNCSSAHLDFFKVMFDFLP